MDRRDFLKATAAGMAAWPLVGEMAEGRDMAGGFLKKAVKSGMVKASSVREKFDIVQSIGFDGIEIDQDLPVDEVVAARKATGLTVHGVVDWVHWKYPLSHPDPEIRRKGLEGLKKAIAAAKAYEASTVLLVPAIVNRDVSYDAAYDRSQTEIRKVLPMARDAGIKIAIENVWNNFLLSPIEARRYCEELGPDVGWYMDVGNIVHYGWPEQWIRILSDRVLKVDVKGYSRKIADKEGRWKGFRAPIGEGDCGWPQVVAALRDVGYRGWATAEVSGGGRKRLTEIKQRMDRVLG